ncbi:MAG: hypothetical protein JOZ58_18725 [Acetobacteraceae bacterium]|nr:hypothetical protein [Acetobacteraceae bacterium]
MALDDAPLAVPNWPFERPEHCNYRGIGLAEMIDALARGHPHRTSPELGAHVVEAADAIIASAHSGSTVELHMKMERPKLIRPSEVEALLGS